MTVEQHPWKRIEVNGKPHNHGKACYYLAAFSLARQFACMSSTANKLLDLGCGAGYAFAGTEVRTTDVSVDEDNHIEVTSGVYPSMTQQMM